MSVITRTIVNSVRRLYPEALADKSWDNTGCECVPTTSCRSPRLLQFSQPAPCTNGLGDSTVLLEVPPLPRATKDTNQKHVVLLTIDLTRAVASEAIEKGAAAIVSYRMSLKI